MCRIAKFSDGLLAANTREPNGMFKMVNGNGAETTAEYLPSASDTSRTESVVSK